MLRRPALAAIRFYQRHLSPRKGYGCPHRLLYGGSGCSGVALRLIRRYGVWRGWLILQKRFARCAAARQQLNPQRYGFMPYQRGECDVPFDDSCCDGLACCADIWESNTYQDSEEERERRRRIDRAYHNKWD